MQFGKTLIGALIGIIVGTALLLAVYLMSGLDKMWLAIPFAFITGVGVRMLVNTAGHPSYLRGALTMVLALLGFIAGLNVVTKVVSARATSAPKQPPAIEKPAEKSTDDSDAKDETKDADKETEPHPTQEKPSAQPKAAPDTMISHSAIPNGSSYSTIDFIFLGIAALVAYEMGRGSGAAVPPANRPAQPKPAGVHPDA